MPRRLLTLLTCALICRIVAGVFLTYRDYIPPNFQSEFLQGRESYFFGWYRWAFYAHVTSGPSSLVLGMILLSAAFRRRFPRWHRRLGRLQVFCICLIVVPSGMWMAFYAETGFIAGVGFATLAIVTGVCVSIGWRAAMERRFTRHQLWMSRCFVLLCSAVVLRLIGGLATIAGSEAEWIYPLAAWASWLVPLVGFELLRRD